MNISVVGRRDGASSVAGAAYISRSRIYDERVGLTRDYRRCHRHERLVADLGVTLPEGAPERWRDRATLWNELERLTDARDEAEGLAEAAKKAAEDNDALIDELADEIAEQQALIDDADAKLPAAAAKADAWAAVFEQQGAESIVTDGFAGTTDDAEIAGILADAHGAYEAKLEELETAKAELEAAEEALAAAKADKEATAKDLAAAEADYAMAKEAYDKLCALMGWDEEPEQGAGQTTKPAGDRTPEQQAGPDDLPGTGDPASVAAAGLALGGLFSVAAGAHFRRRDEK